MPTHIDRYDFMFGQEQLQRYAVAQVDGHAVYACELAFQRVQSQRRMMWIGLQ